jgi:hypothetical protein
LNAPNHDHDPVEAIMVRDLVIPDEPPFIVDDLLHEAATVLYGRPEAGKSYYALSLAAAVTSGAEWLGRGTRRRKVLFMGLDPGQNRQTKRRIDLIPGNVNFLVSQRRPEPNDEWWHRFAGWVKDEGIGLVIIDNLKRLVSKGSVNKDEDVGPVLDRLDMLIDNGCAVLLLHHQGKTGEDGAPKTTPMGATCIEAWGRQFIRVERSRGTRLCTLHVEGNDVEPFKLTTIHVPEGNGKHGAFFTVAAEHALTTVETRERDVRRLDEGTLAAQAVVDSGEVFKSLSACAKYLADNPQDGLPQRNQEAWKKYLMRTVFGAGLLAGGNGEPVVAGPTLTSDVQVAA